MITILQEIDTVIQTVLRNNYLLRTTYYNIMCYNQILWRNRYNTLQHNDEVPFYFK